MTDKKQGSPTQIEIEKWDLSLIKDRLDSVSPSMCLAKWLFMKIHLLTGKTQSCYHVPEHFVDTNEISVRPSALHNTKQKKWERRQMMEGKKPPGCAYCWRIEESENHYSDRHYQSLAPWAFNRFNEVAKNGSEYDVVPSYVEINLNNACNFKCSYCYPEYSTSWEKELKKHGPFPTIIPHNDLSYFKETGSLPKPSKQETPYERAFWKWWPELYSKARVLRLTGGEPLIDHNTFKIMDYVSKHPNPDLELSFTTNLCPPLKMRDRFKAQMEDIVTKKKVFLFKLYASIDSWGPQAEYIRSGLDIRQFEENLELFNRDMDTHTNFIITMNALSVFNLKTLLKKILEWRENFNNSPHRQKWLSHNRINLDLPYLRHPPWQAMHVLPLEITRHYLNDALAFMENNLSKSRTDNPHGFSYIQLGKLKRLLDVIKTPVPEKELRENRVNFYKFFSEHDRRRKTDFLRAFPELKDFWRKCRELAQEWDANPPAGRQKSAPSGEASSEKV